MFCTIVCDIKESRKIKNREAVQYQIIDMLKETNEKFKDIIASPFLITLGDEWQGLLKYPCEYKELVSFFKKTIPNVQFYTGIGIGDVYIHNFELTVNQLDGPSFYRARDAVEIAKKKKLPIVILFDNWDDI